MSSTAPTLFSGEYVLAVEALADQVKGLAAKNVILALGNRGGKAHESLLKKHVSKNIWGKTCQYLVSSKVIEYCEVSKIAQFNSHFWAKTLPLLGNFGCNVNVNVNNLPKDILKRLTSELIPDIASCGRVKREDSFSLTTQADAEVLTEDWIDWSTKHWCNVEPLHMIPFTIPPDYETYKAQHTEQIIGYLVHLTDEQRRIYKHNFKLVRKIFYEKGISDDLIDRIVLMQLAIGIDPFAAGARQIRKWKRKCDKYKNKCEESGKKGRAWVCLAAIVQKIYERAGVQWGRCKRRKDYEPLQAEAQIIRKDFYINRLRTTRTLWEHQAMKKFRQSGRTTADLVIWEREMREARDMFDGMPPDFKKPYKRHGRRGRKPQKQRSDKQFSAMLEVSTPPGEAGNLQAVEAPTPAPAETAPAEPERVTTVEEAGQADLTSFPNPRVESAPADFPHRTSAAATSKPKAAKTGRRCLVRPYSIEKPLFQQIAQNRRCVPPLQHRYWTSAGRSRPPPRVRETMPETA